MRVAWLVRVWDNPTGTMHHCMLARTKSAAEANLARYCVAHWEEQCYLLPIPSGPGGDQTREQNIARTYFFNQWMRLEREGAWAGRAGEMFSVQPVYLCRDNETFTWTPALRDSETEYARL